MKPSCEDPAPGIYLWDLATDRVVTDTAAAQSFGIDPTLAKRGLPINDYLRRIHSDDLPRVACSIREAIMTGQPYQEEYRVADADGKFTNLLAFGTCFREGDDQPSQYAGIVFPKTDASRSDISLQDLCLLAHDMALGEGRAQIAEKLLEIVRSLGAVDSNIVPFPRSP